MRVIKKIDLNMNLTCCDALGENIIEKVINEYDIRVASAAPIIP